MALEVLEITSLLPVTIYHRLHSVGDYENRAIFERVTYGCLDLFIGFLIHIGSGFVDTDHLV